jgi:dolichol-phosphate mannosyltransferase
MDQTLNLMLNNLDRTGVIVKNQDIQQPSNPTISVVVPVYGCCSSLTELYTRLDVVLSAISVNYEIIMVDDASPDYAWEVIQQLASADARVKGIHLSRNFGQHYAITAGLDYANGDWVVVMDCDLQDVPEEIANLYLKTQEGYDVVVGRRANRQDLFFKKLVSKIFYQVFAYFTGSKIDNRIGNYGIYAQKVIVSIRRFREQNRSFGLFALWVGFKRAEIDVKHAKRTQGQTSYTFKKMLGLALDSIVSHSNKLLRLTVAFGFALSTLSLAYAFWIIISYFMWKTPVVGWTSLIVSLYLTTGLVIGNIGIVGLYVGKIFNEVKKRPLYIIDSTTFEVNTNDK